MRDRDRISVVLHDIALKLKLENKAFAANDDAEI